MNILYSDLEHLTVECHSMSIDVEEEDIAGVIYDFMQQHYSISSTQMVLLKASLSRYDDDFTVYPFRTS